MFQDQGKYDLLISTFPLIVYKCNAPRNIQILFMTLEYATIGSENGLSPARHQAIIWTITGLL